MSSRNKPEEPKKKDMGLYGIDWDNDGNVDLVDDLISEDMYRRTLKPNDAYKNAGGGCGTCLLSVLSVPVLLFIAILAISGAFIG